MCFFLFGVALVVCARVDKVLLDNIKQASLECYLYSRGHQYTTMTLPHLSATFDMPVGTVRGESHSRVTVWTSTQKCMVHVVCML